MPAASVPLPIRRFKADRPRHSTAQPEGLEGRAPTLAPKWAKNAGSRSLVKKADQEAVDALDRLDPAREVIQTILELAPASYWLFERFNRHSGKGQIVGPGGTADEQRHRDLLKTELTLQQELTKEGSIIGPTLVPTGQYPNALTLIFADSHKTYAIMMLARSDELGPFTSNEIRMLTFALEAISDMLSSLGIIESVHGTFSDSFLDTRASLSERQPAMYVLGNPDMKVAYASVPRRQRTNSASTEQPHNRLPAVIERAVRELTSQWTEDPETHHPASIQPLPFIIVRVQPMTGPNGTAIGVLLERSHRRVSLRAATTHFALSARELQVLVLLLGGKSLAEIGETLGIAPSTGQDYIRNLLTKTDSHNRAEMIRKIMEWDEDA